MEYKPYYYQDFAEKFILDNPEAGLLLDMGMGKTVTSLSAADKLLNDYFAVSKVLVIAPLKPASCRALSPARRSASELLRRYESTSSGLSALPARLRRMDCLTYGRRCTYSTRARLSAKP